MAICTAKSSRTGNPCKRPAIKGGNVCISHGGKAPQVIANAKLRLASLVDPAIGVLDNLLRKSKVDAVKMQAVKDILDRNGFKPKDVIEVNGNLVERLLSARKRIKPNDAISDSK